METMSDADARWHVCADEFDKRKCPASSFPLFFSSLPVPVKLTLHTGANDTGEEP